METKSSSLDPRSRYKCRYSGRPPRRCPAWSSLHSPVGRIRSSHFVEMAQPVVPVAVVDVPGDDRPMRGAKCSRTIERGVGRRPDGDAIKKNPYAQVRNTLATRGQVRHAHPDVEHALAKTIGKQGEIDALTDLA